MTPPPASPGLRRHGPSPFRIAVVHGGPGAAGELAPVARELASAGLSVLEPLQAAGSVAGQIEELAAVLSAYGAAPVTLIGFSWGAWLCLLTAAAHPRLVRQLILVGCGPLEECYVPAIRDARWAKLTTEERADWTAAELVLADRGGAEAPKAEAFARLAALAQQTDAVDPLPDSDPVCPQAEIYASVWPGAAALRRSGELLTRALAVRCPVLAVHGADDPHPADGVRLPLAGLKDFSFHLLPDCGHTPWRERRARELFYTVLHAAIRPR